MSSLAWSPDPVSRRSESPALGKRRRLLSPRRMPRFGKLSKEAWTFEQRLMMLTFAASLVFGYIASTFLWQLVLGTNPFSLAPPQAQPGHTKGIKALASKFRLLTNKEKAALDARAHVGLFANVPPQQPPYTRAKYLEYFSFVPYNKIPQQTLVDPHSAQMGRVLRLPFTGSNRATHNHTLTENDFWAEIRFEGVPVITHAPPARSRAGMWRWLFRESSPS